MPEYGVTVNATFKKTQAQLDKEAVEAAQAAVEGGNYTIAQATGNTDAAVKTWLVNTLNVLFGQTYGVQFRSATFIVGDVTITAFTPAVAGTESKPEGVNGSFKYTVTLSKGETTLTTKAVPGIIIATPHSVTQVKRIELMLLGDLTVRVINTGNVATGRLTFALSGANADVFTLSATTISDLGVGKEADITFTPRSALAVGVYTATFTASGEGMDARSVEITYEVEPTNIDEVSPASSLRAWVENGILYVSGLKVGKPWSVYNLSGRLIYRDIAIGEIETLSAKSLQNNNVYIIQSEEETVKVWY